MTLRLRFVCLSSVLAVACGGSPLSTQSGAELSIFMSRTSTFVASLTVSLADPSGSCPTLSATADLNGTAVPLTKPGGMKGGSFFFIPTSTCVAPGFSFTSGVDPGEILAGVPMTLTIKDSSATVVAKNDDALTVDARAVPAARRVGGEPFVFELTRPVLGLETSSLSFRRDGQVELVSSSTYDQPRVVDGGTVVSTVPTAGPGSYTWFLATRFRVEGSSCVGVAVCQPVWLALSTQGTFTIDP